MEKTKKPEKNSYIKPTIKKVVLTANERVAACGSDPGMAPGGCKEVAPTLGFDGPGAS